MIAITRYTVATEQAEEFAARAGEVLDLLARRPGFRHGCVGRAADDPSTWTLVTQWDGAGYYRRALSDFEVRMVAVPLMSEAHDEPTAFEVLSERPEHPARPAPRE